MTYWHKFLAWHCLRPYILLGLFALLLLLFIIGLQRGDPSHLPNALQGRDVPALTLPPLYDDGRLSGLLPEHLRQSVPVLLNIWASWCGPCREEHPLLMQLAARGIQIYGLNYRDMPDAARRFIGQLGNPYQAIGVDENGRAALELGIYGVPETFIIDAGGIIRTRHAGPLSEEFIAETILPLFEQ